MGTEVDDGMTQHRGQYMGKEEIVYGGTHHATV